MKVQKSFRYSEEGINIEVSKIDEDQFRMGIFVYGDKYEKKEQYIFMDKETVSDFMNNLKNIL